MVTGNSKGASTQSSVITGHVQPENRPPRTKSVVMFVVACIAIAVVLTVWIAQATFYTPTPPTVSTLNQILTYVDGHQAAAVDGAVKIPASLASESITWRAYITKDGTNTYVFVPSWIGRKTDLPLMRHADDWVEGYLYSAVPLQTGGVKRIDLNVPAEAIPEHATIDERTRNVPMVVDKHVGNDWYQVTLAQ